MKSQLSIVEKRAISSQKLQNRLDLNKKLGSKNLTEWLFLRYKIKKKDKILELGCGIGSHVIKESKIIGNDGFVLATDYSTKSLEVLKKRSKSKNIKIKRISMDNILNYLKSKKNNGYFNIVKSAKLYKFSIDNNK